MREDNSVREEVKATLEQIGRLTDAGCEIVRVACPGEEDVKVHVKKPKEQRPEGAE